MGFQDVVFLSSIASFSTTFLKNCDGGKGHGTTTCLEIVVVGKQGHVSCKILLHQQSFFYVS